MLRYGIPPYRLPKSIVDRDIKNITALGVKIHTGSQVSSVKELREHGFEAVFLGMGTLKGYSMNLPGENSEEVMDCMTFLKASATGYIDDLSGKRIAIIGGGNSAIDPARTALRLKAEKVSIYYRRSRAEMPAHDWEVQAALDEGVQLHELKMPTRFISNNGHLHAIECLDMELGLPDESGRRRPVPVDGSEKTDRADMVILAIGLRPETADFTKCVNLATNERIIANPETLATSEPGVFAGGDVVTGPSMIIQAIAQGKRAAFYMDRFLAGKSLEEITFDQRLPTMQPEDVFRRSGDNISRRDPVPLPQVPLNERTGNGIGLEVEGTMSEEDARYSAGRCLDCGGCSECQQCITACPADAIHFEMRQEDSDVEAGAVVMATGFELFDPRKKTAYGYGRFPNVIDAMQMDRILAPTRPYNSVLRPSDGKTPSNIAFVLCTGSRDESVGNRLCSQICCMYSLKQAQLAMGALPLADITIYYIDIRAFGKGYDEFYEQAKGMGVYFVKGRIGRIEENSNQDLTLYYEDMLNEGGIKKAEHDLVVLSIGILPNTEALGIFKNRSLEREDIPFIHEIDTDLEPCKTSIDGVFVAGGASASRDIPDSIMHAGAAAAQAAVYLNMKGVRK
jgi:heterodisulfide reductase subunit A